MRSTQVRFQEKIWKYFRYSTNGLQKMQKILLLITHHNVTPPNPSTVMFLLRKVFILWSMAVNKGQDRCRLRSSIRCVEPRWGVSCMRTSWSSSCIEFFGELSVVLWYFSPSLELDGPFLWSTLLIFFCVLHLRRRSSYSVWVRLV